MSNFPAAPRFPSEIRSEPNRCRSSRCSCAFTTPGGHLYCITLRAPAAVAIAGRRASKRSEATAEDRPAAKDRRPPIPSNPTLPKLQDAARNCRACDLWRNATQTVFGAGPPRAKIMLIGEQPGNDEDLDGRPFVGPAGKLLDRALIEAGIDRTEVYVTNAVKHFKWEPRGKRRIHKKPNSAEIAACRPWLEAEIAVVRPQVIICMGATAAQSLLGRDFRVTQHRGEFLESPLAPAVTATIHPSAILRAPTKKRAHRIRQVRCGPEKGYEAALKCASITRAVSLPAPAATAPAPPAAARSQNPFPRATNESPRTNTRSRSSYEAAC